jgi:hypothetical protein
MKIETLRNAVERKAYQAKTAKDLLKQRLLEWAEAKAELEIKILEERKRFRKQ